MLESRSSSWRSCGSAKLVVSLRRKGRRASERVVIIILMSVVSTRMGFADNLS